jgi:hypothetical protein
MQMAQHFLLSKSAKTLSLASVFQMKDEEAEMTFRPWREDNRRVSNGGSSGTGCRDGDEPQQVSGFQRLLAEARP